MQLTNLSMTPPPDQNPKKVEAQPVTSPEVQVERLNTKTRSSITEIQKIEAHFSGPLPHPSILQGYENCMPGAADRILRMTENESEHRRSIEKLVITSDFAEARRGQYCATAITLGALLVAAYSFQLGHEIIGSLFGAGSIASIILALLKVKTVQHEANQPSTPKPPVPQKSRRKK